MTYFFNYLASGRKPPNLIGCWRTLPFSDVWFWISYKRWRWTTYY